jgi:hypothetical protein
VAWIRPYSLCFGIIRLYENGWQVWTDAFRVQGVFFRKTKSLRDCRRVRDSNGNNLDTFPSAMGVITRLACGRARQEGVEVELLLRKAGLTYQQIDDPCARLAVKGQIRFLELAATTLKDECLGFHLAQKFDLRMGGLFYYVLASSDTLDEALQRGVRYSAIVNEGITLRLRDGSGFE